MSKTTSKPETTTDVPTNWPPKAHIIHPRDHPVKEGTLALCGAKLMGVFLGMPNHATAEVCKECASIAKRYQP